MLQQLKQFFKNNERDIILISGVILISLISFGAGRLSAPTTPKSPITFEKMPLEASIFRQAQDDNISNITGNQNINQDNQKTEKPKNLKTSEDSECLFVGSKNSNKYHYLWCIGAKNISPNNKICFNSKEDAESRGYSPAGNCPGL